MKSNFICLLFIFFHSIRFKLNWNIGDKRKLFSKLKSKLGLCHVVLTTPKTSREKLTQTLVELHQLPDVGKTDSKGEISCPKWTKFNGRRKVCVNFQIETNKLNIVVNRYRKSFYLEDNEVVLKLSEDQLLLAKRVYLLGYFDIFYKWCIALVEITVHN